MEFLTALVFSLCFSGMALWVRDLYTQLERTRAKTRAIARENRSIAERLKLAESTIKGYEQF